MSPSHRALIHILRICSGFEVLEDSKSTAKTHSFQVFRPREVTIVRTAASNTGQ